MSNNIKVDRAQLNSKEILKLYLQNQKLHLKWLQMIVVSSTQDVAQMI